jgi:hypothetical protein
MIRYGFLTTTGEPENVESALQDKKWKRQCMMSSWLYREIELGTWSLLKKVEI